MTDNGRKPVILPGLPARSKVCKYDAFMSSTPYNGKVFLFPWETTDRKGDWLKNYGFCAAHCAEMVTISSAAENSFFLNFMRRSELTDAVWLGAQVKNQTLSGWTDGQSLVYENKATGEYNDDGLTCLTAAYGVTNDKWYNYFCDYNSYFVACQRGASWTPNIVSVRSYFVRWIKKL